MRRGTESMQTPPNHPDVAVRCLDVGTTPLLSPELRVLYSHTTEQPIHRHENVERMTGPDHCGAGALENWMGKGILKGDTLLFGLYNARFPKGIVHNLMNPTAIAHR